MNERGPESFSVSAISTKWKKQRASLKTRRTTFAGTIIEFMKANSVE